MSKTNILAVNELFGVTFQGEGKNVGMPCAFLRLAGCNLACSWCDTRYAWDWSQYDPKVEMRPMTVEDVYQRLSAMSVSNLVITGGEPMLQQRALALLTKRLHADKWHTEMETAGTIKPITTELVKQFTVSPKLSHSGNDPRKAIRPDALRTFAASNRAVFKFVATSLDDLDEIDSLVRQFSLQPVYVMPEGVNVADLDAHMQEISIASIERGYYLTPRLHIQLFGQRRGV